MTDWVRLWHDMPTDPKWRTIAKRSGRSIAEVIAVFNFLMVDASANAAERGRTHKNASEHAEDIAAAIDVETEAIEGILSAMRGRVIDKDGWLLGWEKRQPKREDSGSAARARAWRERNRTQPNAPKRPETETETDIGDATASPSRARGTRIPLEFSPDAARLSKARDLGFQDEEIRECVREFVSYWSDIPGSRGLRVNWQGTFENRLAEIAGRKKTSNGKYNIRDSIDEAIKFRRWEESQASSGSSSQENLALLPGLRKGSV